VNILSYESPTSAESSRGRVRDKEALFVPCQLEVRYEDLTSVRRERTAVDRLETGVLAERNV